MEVPLSRDELIRLVERIRAANGTEDEIHEWLMLARRSVVDPQMGNYINHPDREMSAEEVVDRALAYKPLQL